MLQARLRRWAAWGANKGPAWFVALAPPIIALVAVIFAASARRAVRRNLRRIHGRRSWLRESVDILATFAQFARNLTESLAPARFAGTYELIQLGDGPLFELLEGGKGALIVTAHVGPWDSTAMVLSHYPTARVMMLMAREAHVEAQQVQDELRSSEQVEVLRIGDSPLDALPAVEHLKQGGVVLAQMDREWGTRAPLWGQLFDQPFALPSGLIRLASMTQTPLVPAFTARLKKGRRLVRTGDLIWVPQRANNAERQRCADAYLAQLQAHVAAFPTQWFHFVKESVQ